MDVADLIDAQGIADLLGLSQRNTVSRYQRRYTDMPRPVLDLGRGRPRLWSRAEITAWVAEREHRNGRARTASPCLPS